MAAARLVVTQLILVVQKLSVAGLATGGLALHGCNRQATVPSCGCTPLHGGEGNSLGPLF